MNAPIFMTDQTTSDSGPHGSRVMGPSELLRILRRRRLIIFLTIGLILGLTALVLQTVTPLYRSEAIVIVESRSEEHTSELQSLMRISYAVFCLTKKKSPITQQKT